MAISRPVLLALLGAALLGATVLAVQSARTGSDSDAAPAAVQTDPAQPGTQPTANSTPQQTLQQAFDLGKVESARFAARLRVADGKQALGFGLTGAFERGAAGDIPKVDVRGRISLGGRAVTGGFVSLGDKAYFVKGDTGWRLPPEIWDPVVDAVAKGSSAQSGPALPIHPATWVKDVTSEGSDTVGGVTVDHVSATVDPKAVANDFVQAAKANGAQGVPSTGAFVRAVKRAELDVWAGADDHIMRRVTAVVVLAGNARLALDVRLTDVNKPQQIEAPAHVRAGAPGGALGAFADGLVRGVSGGSTSLKALTSPNPGRAARAVRKHKKVVILFRNPRGLDDKAMSSVLRNVNQRTQALILTDDVAAVDRYGKLVEDLGVSQTPSVVIIDRKGNARLLEGYVDSNTLTQAVADAR